MTVRWDELELPGGRRLVRDEVYGFLKVMPARPRKSSSVTTETPTGIRASLMTQTAEPSSSVKSPVAPDASLRSDAGAVSSWQPLRSEAG